MRDGADGRRAYAGRPLLPDGPKRPCWPRRGRDGASEKVRPFMRNRLRIASVSAAAVVGLAVGVPMLPPTAATRAAASDKPAAKHDEKHDAKAAPKAPAKPKVEAFDRLKSLAGTWVAVDPKGKVTDTVVSVFRVTAGGSAVHETVFPGAGHEMVTVYHLDGESIVLTHYCAVGNAPRMRLDPKSPADELRFLFDGGTNLDPAKDMHMHEGSIRFLDADTIQWTWQAWAGGKVQADHKADIKLVRKK